MRRRRVIWLLEVDFQHRNGGHWALVEAFSTREQAQRVLRYGYDPMPRSMRGYRIIATRLRKFVAV